MRYAYPCIVERDEEEAAATGRTCYLATFPDVHAAHTSGWSVQEVNGHLRDCLETALSLCIEDNEPLPEPRASRQPNWRTASACALHVLIVSPTSSAPLSQAKSNEHWLPWACIWSAKSPRSNGGHQALTPPQHSEPSRRIRKPATDSDNRADAIHAV